MMINYYYYYYYNHSNMFIVKFFKIATYNKNMLSYLLLFYLNAV